MKISNNPILQIVFTAVLLLFPLWYNGSPLYYPDSFGYIFWGMQMLPPPERAGTYALFVKIFSLGKSLWYNILIQGVLIAYVIRILFHKIFEIRQLTYLYCSAFILGIGSTLGWTASMLMPDIFCVLSSIGLGILLLFPEKLKNRDRILVGLIFLFSSIQHVSIFIINFLIVSGFSVYFLVEKRFSFYWKRMFLLCFLVAAGYGGIGLVHKTLTGEFYISKTSNAFILSRLAETGILSNYLDENCGIRNLKLCARRSSLPMAGEYFLWSKNSFIHTDGGLHDSEGAYQEVISGIFSSPKYLFQFGQAALKATMKQLTLIRTGDGLGAGNDAFQLRFFGSDYADYLTSKQHQTIDFEMINLFQYLVLGSLIFLVIATRSHQNMSPELRMFAWFLLFLFLANALVNGALSTPLNRYQARIFWLADFWLLTALFPKLQTYFSFVSKSPQ